MAIQITTAVIIVAVYLIQRGCADSALPQTATPTTNPSPNVKQTLPGNNPAPANNQANSDASIPPIKYPNPGRNESVQYKYANAKSDTGYTFVKDPYSWMENSQNPETIDFIKEEMNITNQYLAKFPFRKALGARLKELWNYPTFSGLMQAGDKFFSSQNTGLQDQDVLFIHNSINDTGTEFFNPNKLSEDGSITVTDYEFSDDGQVFAYTTSANGSDWNTLQFMSVEKGGPFYEEKLTKIKFSSISFTKNGKGVFYSGYPDYKGEGDGDETEEVKNQKLFYHVLGTNQNKDVIVAEYPKNPDYFVTGSVSDDGRYLIVSISEGSDNNLVYIADLALTKYEITGKLQLKQVVTVMEANYAYVTNTETKFVFMTNKNADNYKLVTIDIANANLGPNSWKDLVKEHEKNVLQWATAAWKNYLVLGYIQDVKSVVQLHNLNDGTLVKKFDLEIGTVSTVYADKKYKDIFFTFESFCTPGIIYHCDLSKSSFDVDIIHEIKVKNFDRTKYTVDQVFFKSKDGTSIPMFLLYKKGLQKTGNTYTLMTTFGGFGESDLPNFGVSRLITLDNFSGIRALVNCRGGGEYGESWHRAGMLHNKQNTFDDFIAAAQYLINEKYTSPKKLVINGGGNGGLVVCACVNQRPDLFGVAISDEGGLDMLRFDQFTGGHAWVTEFGKPTNATDFPFIYAWSPLHNIRIAKIAPKQYPAMMLTTSDHNDRIPMLHSLKMIATLQYQAKQNPNQKNPLIVRVEEDGGTGGPNTIDKSIAAFVDFYSFIAINTGAQYKGGPQTAKFK